MVCALWCALRRAPITSTSESRSVLLAVLRRPEDADTSAVVGLFGMEGSSLGVGGLRAAQRGWDHTWRLATEDGPTAFRLAQGRHGRPQLWHWLPHRVDVNCSGHESEFWWRDSSLTGRSAGLTRCSFGSWLRSRRPRCSAGRRYSSCDGQSVQSHGSRRCTHHYSGGQCDLSITPRILGRDARFGNLRATFIFC